MKIKNMKKNKESMKMEADVRESQANLSQEEARTEKGPSMPLFLYGASYQEHLEVAQKLHEHSAFAAGIFVEARLTSIPRALRYRAIFGPVLEELMPHLEVLGGNKSAQSWLLQAEGGTLFIDEVDALTAEMQQRILELLEEKSASFRIIFASQYSPSLLNDMKCLRPEFLTWLVSLNGRQSLGAERVLAIKEIPRGAKKSGLQGLGRALEPILIEYVSKGLERESYDLHATVIGEVERPLIEMALRYARGNQLKTASLLGLNRNTLRKRIKELGIMIPQKGIKM